MPYSKSAPFYCFTNFHLLFFLFLFLLSSVSSSVSLPSKFSSFIPVFLLSFCFLSFFYPPSFSAVVLFVCHPTFCSSCSSFSFPLYSLFLCVILPSGVHVRLSLSLFIPCCSSFAFPVLCFPCSSSFSIPIDSPFFLLLSPC